MSSATAANAPVTEAAMQPVPERFPIIGVPFATRKVRRPSETTSISPVIATTVPVALAHSLATSTGSPDTPPESTPLTVPPRPDNTPISPAFPFRIATTSSSRSRRTVSVRILVAPAPTGSRITGIPRSFARAPARSIAPTWASVRVPIFRTRAPASPAISAASSGASAMTGAAPAQSVMLAQSLMVTRFVMWCTSGRSLRTRANRLP